MIIPEFHFPWWHFPSWRQTSQKKSFPQTKKTNRVHTFTSEKYYDHDTGTNWHTWNITKNSTYIREARGFLVVCVGQELWAFCQVCLCITWSSVSTTDTHNTHERLTASALRITYLRVNETKTLIYGGCFSLFTGAWCAGAEKCCFVC